MNHDEKLAPTNISDILEKMNENLRSFAIRETEWIIQKNSYECKIAELEGEISAHEQINIDLMKRIKMLEYALIQERNKNSPEDIDNGLKDNHENKKDQISPTEIYNLLEKRELMSDEEINAIKEKATRPSLLAMLNEIGINENFANELFTDLELNKGELERLIKKDLEERTLLVNEKKGFSLDQPESNNKRNSNVNNSGKGYEKQESKLQDSTKVDSNVSNINQTQSTPKSKPGQLILSQNNYTELRSHFDVVRKLSYIPKHNYLVSVAEDCLINVWQANKINFNNTVTDIEPLYCFRGHTGPLFSLETYEDLIYSAGNEGIIKIWRLPRYSEVSPFGDCEVLFNCNIAFFQKTNEIIWDIKHHPKKNLLSSLSSDGFAYFWKTGTPDEYFQSLTDNKLDKWYLSKLNCQTGSSNSSNNSNSVDINPTTGHYLNNDNNVFAVGMTDGSITFIDINKLSVINNTKNTKHLNSGSLVYNNSGKKPDPDLLNNKLDSSNKLNINTNMSMNNLNFNNSSNNQVNCIASSLSNSIVYAGFEDGLIKYFDYRSENCFTPVNAHDDAVTSLLLLDDLYLFSTSHDTKIRLWDIRDMSQPLQETLGSQKKWDEAIWDSVFIPNSMSLATAGADSIIRIFKI